jgi:cellulose synthase/poly-beta-1,6-N-acetylglucosamine synthase-like glycosyltransferase
MISIVITSFREPRLIGRAIEAAMRQKIKERCEIIVIAPDKETLDVAHTYARKDKRVRVIRDAGKGKPTALNTVFTKARGDIFVLTDGDVYMGENAVASLLSHMRDTKIGAVTGRVVSTNKVDSMVDYWAHLGAETFHNMRMLQVKHKENVLCSGYLYAVRKNLLRTMPVNTLADDAFITESVWQHQKKTAYEPQAHVYVHYPTTLIDWIKQKKRTAGRFYYEQ